MATRKLANVGSVISSARLVTTAKRMICASLALRGCSWVSCEHEAKYVYMLTIYPNRAVLYWIKIKASGAEQMHKQITQRKITGLRNPTGRTRTSSLFVGLAEWERDLNRGPLHYKSSPPLPLGQTASFVKLIKGASSRPNFNSKSLNLQLRTLKI